MQFLNIVQKSCDPPPPPLSFEHYVVNFSEGILTKDISRLKHPFYALVYAAKGPFVLYKIYNISFEHGNDLHPRLNIVKKNSYHFSYMEASLRDSI